MYIIYIYTERERESDLSNKIIIIYIYILYAARDPAALCLAVGSLKAGLDAENSLAYFGLCWVVA